MELDTLSNCTFMELKYQFFSTQYQQEQTF